MNKLINSFCNRIVRCKYPSCVLPSLHNNTKLCYSRNYCTSNEGPTIKMSDVKELQIPMPYGKITAKAWGSETGQPVLAFHGWLDNCGTYDKLIPLLSDKFYIVAVDAPGHGMSSHKPYGCLYSDTDTIIDYKKVVDYLGWTKFHLMGHSFGGAMAFFFASLFPDLVGKLVTLDIGKPFSVPQAMFPHVIIKAMSDVMKLEKKLSKPPPVYTHEEAAVRLREGMYKEITPEAAEILLKRGTRPSDCGKGLIFSRDLRCRPIEYISLRSHELVFQYMSAVRCEVMTILATNTNPNYQPDSPEILDEVFDIYRKHAKRFVLERVEGNHFVHLNNPERVSPIINTFLSDET